MIRRRLLGLEVDDEVGAIPLDERRARRSSARDQTRPRGAQLTTVAQQLPLLVGRQTHGLHVLAVGESQTGDGDRSDETG